jgi:uncharacterized membrane protein YfcA
MAGSAWRAAEAGLWVIPNAGSRDARTTYRSALAPPRRLDNEAMEPSLGLIVGVAALAGFVQGLSGFGFSLVALSIWAWTLDPKLAAVLAVAGGFTGQVIAAVTLRRGFEWARLMPFVAGGLLGLPLGLMLLPHLDPIWFKAVIGGVLFVWCPLMLASRRLPHVQLGGRLADGVAGAMGGVGGALGGLTGAIPTLWCTLRGYPRDIQRSIIQNFNLAFLGLTLLGYLATGVVQASMALPIAVTAPAILITTLVGARVYVGISDLAFHRIVLSLLTASGVAMLAHSLPQLLKRLAAA